MTSIMNDYDGRDLLSVVNSAIKKGADSFADRTTGEDPAIEPPKRFALANIDPNHAFKHNFVSKDSIWSTSAVTEGLVSASLQRPLPQPLAFEIFQDSCTEETCPPAPKEKRLPLYLRKLYNDRAEESKENEYWSDDYEENMVDDEEKKLTEARWTAPFWNSIHNHLRGIETQLAYDSCGIRYQKDITEDMRTILIDWLLEVGEEYKISEETVHLATAHVDRSLQHKSIGRHELQLLGITALFVACKQVEVYPPELKDFVYITNDTYSKRHILKTEQWLLKTLDFQILFPTANTFLEMYTHVVESTMNSMTVHLSCYICDVTLLYADVLEFLPSQIGAACLAIARKLMTIVGNQQGEVWPQSLCAETGYSLDDLRQAALVVYRSYARVCQSSTKTAVYKKYLNRKYEEVATIKVPRYLEL